MPARASTASLHPSGACGRLQCCSSVKSVFPHQRALPSPMCTIGHTVAPIAPQNRVSNRHVFWADLACRPLHGTAFRVRVFWRALSCADFPNHQDPSAVRAFDVFRHGRRRQLSAARCPGIVPMEGAEWISWVSGFCSGWLDAHLGWTFLVIVAIAFFALQSLLQTHHQADRHGTQPDRR